MKQEIEKQIEYIDKVKEINKENNLKYNVVELKIDKIGATVLEVDKNEGRLFSN